MLNLPLNRNIFTEVCEGERKSEYSEFLTVTSIQRVETILCNLHKMEEYSKGTPSEYLWKTKKDEFRRQMRWNALRELTAGNERRVKY